MRAAHGFWRPDLHEQAQLNTLKVMAKFFSPNIGRTGRIIRGSMCLAFLVAALCLLKTSLWASVVLFVSSAFTGYEAVRGWCVMRACGVKTKY